MYPGPSVSSLVNRGTGALLSSCAAWLLISACAHVGPSDGTTLSHAGKIAGEQVVAVAKTLVGVPYRYGGTSPNGFDCSGLVQYAYKEIGVNVPRSTRDQLRYAQSVPVPSLRAGDVLFFRVSDRKISHVGIYTGDGQFIHAPSSGGRVSYARIDNPFWKKRLISAGRLY